MNRELFDELARGLATNRLSRRQVLKGLLAGALLGLVPGCPAGCPGGQTRCDNSCVDTQTNASHCGACRNECLGDQTCINGQCECDIPCPELQVPILGRSGYCECTGYIEHGCPENQKPCYNPYIDKYYCVQDEYVDPDGQRHSAFICCPGRAEPDLYRGCNPDTPHICCHGEGFSTGLIGGVCP